MSDDVTIAMVQFCLARQDTLVLAFTYTDRKGRTTERVVSPQKMLSETTFQAMCLLRGDVRTFDISRCSRLKIGFAIEAMVENVEPEPDEAPF